MKDAGLVLPDRLAGRFTIVGILGKGSYGVALRVVDGRVGRQVALKLLERTADTLALARFEREAVALARVVNDHVLRIFEHGVEEGVPYLVTELVEGRSLDQLPVGGDPLPAMLQVAEGLEAVHAAGLIHRDVKPANVLLGADGRAVLIDFGLVHFPDSTRLTRPQEVLGTLAFMAPEILRGAPPSKEHDWYAWGGSLYYLYEREPPRTREELIGAARGMAFPPLVFPRKAAPVPVQGLVRAMIDYPAELRLVGLESIRAALESGAPPEPPPLPTEPRAVPGSVGAGRPGGPAGAAGAGRKEPSTAAFKPVGRGSRVGVVLRGAMVSGLVIGGLVWSTREAPAPVSDAPSGGSPAGLAVPDEILVEELERQLPRGTEDVGSAYLLPRRWMECPPYRSLVTWLNAGGLPERIPLPLRGRLEVLSRKVVERGGPDPFSPWFDTARGAPVEVSKSPLVQWLPEYLGPRGAQGGWAAEVWRAAERVHELHFSSEEALKRFSASGEVVAGMPPEMKGYRLVAMQQVQEFMESMAGGTAGLDVIVAWNLRPAAEMRRLWWATWRTIREEPGSAEAAAALSQLVCERFIHLGYSGWLVFPLSELMPPPDDSPVGAFFHANALQTWFKLRRTCRLPVRKEDLEEVLPFLDKASRGDAAGGSVEALRIGLASADMVSLLFELQRPKEALAKFKESRRPVLGMGTSSLTHRTVVQMMAYWERTGAADPEDLEAIKGWGRDNEKRLQKGESGRALLVKLGLGPR